MSLASDIEDVFNSMAPTEYEASDGTKKSSVSDLADYILGKLQDDENFDPSVKTNAKDDEWMCNQIGDIIVDYLSGATIIAAAVAGTISAGVFTATGPATASGWEIDSPADDMLDACGKKDDSAIASGWGNAIDSVLQDAECKFNTIAGVAVSGPSSIPTVITGKGTVSAFGKGAIGTALSTVFTSMASMTSGGDAALANALATAITTAVASMVAKVEGTGAGQGAQGIGTTTPGS